MNGRLRVSRAASYIVLFWAAVALCWLGPGGALKRDRLFEPSQVLSGKTLTADMEHQIQQVFLADGTYLRYLDIYVESPDSAGDVYGVTVYDELGNLLCSRRQTMPGTQLPGYLRIPLGFETVPGRAYVWQIKSMGIPMTVALQNTGETGTTLFGNCYLTADGGQRMFEAENVLMRLVYTDSPSRGVQAACMAGVALLGIGAVLLLEYVGKRREKPGRTVPRMAVAWLTVGVGLGGGLCWLFWSSCVKGSFGTNRLDRTVYALGILVAFGFLLLALFGRQAAESLYRGKGRREKGAFAKTENSVTEEEKKRMRRERCMDCLQTVCFAGALFGCIHYMNALYQLGQDCAYREVALWVCALLLTMGPWEDVFCKFSAVWLPLAALAGFLFYRWRLPQFAEGEEQLARYGIALAVAAGPVAFALCRKIRRGNFFFSLRGRALPWLFSLLLACIVIFRNGRGWPVYLAVIFLLLAVFWAGWEGRSRFLPNLCNGIILNFALVALFCVLRRPYRIWIYTRYPLIFHTVTVTAVYLTLVLCALTVRILEGRSGGVPFWKATYRMWPTLLLYGMAASFLFLTVSRTGYLTVAVMTALTVPFVTVGCQRQGVMKAFSNLGMMALFFVLCLPMTYSAVRLLPALYNDPCVYEIEEGPAAIHRDDPKDGISYMSVSYFLQHVLQRKLVLTEAGTDGGASREIPQSASAPWRTDAPTRRMKTPAALLEGAFGKLTVISVSTPVAGNGEFAPPEADFSNGRLDIFQAYMEEWNLTGHQEMGVSMPDGSVTLHAHNTLLQVIHDYGLITGVVFLMAFAALLAASLVLALRVREGRRTVCALPLVILAAFLTAGMAEWLFHPCDPIGFCALAVSGDGARTRRRENGAR